MREPIWLYDYGMLFYQNGEFREGAEAFRQLRRGQKFFAVPAERAVYLTKDPKSGDPCVLQMFVQSVDRASGKGWGRIAHPLRLPDAVPFSIRAFESRDEPIRIRAAVSCVVTIRPAGPFAEPRTSR